MSKKVLIAFDDSENAMRAVKHVARFLAADSEVTLFTVLQDTAALCEMNSPELIPYFKSHQDSFCILEEKKKELVAAAQAKAKELLVQNGFAADRVHVKSQTKHKGIARDIVAEAGTGYDLIVIGRRGASGIREFFLGSISQKIVNSAQEASILIVN
jgi:nucleotide-binding universal stress UspA family protein